MALTDAAIRKVKPAGKTSRVWDERGLYLEISPCGGKWWRLKYRFAGKEKRISMGIYPDVGLKDARERRDAARRLLANGIDPSEDRKSQKTAQIRRSADNFEAVAKEWHAKFMATWSKSHGECLIRQLERDVFPWLGSRPVAEITAPDILMVLRRIEARGALVTAHRALGNFRQVLRYAIATGRADRDPSSDLRGALPPVKAEHFAATTDAKRLGEILRKLRGYRGTPVVRAALQLAPLVFVRPVELRTAQWADIDLDAAEWRYTVTKTNTPHIVPLSRQALAILRDLQPVTGRGRYVFPSARSKEQPMSDNAMLAAMRRLGIGKDEMSGHGFRATARTILDEVLGIRPDYIEHQLAHTVRDPNGRAYNRTAHLAGRRDMMQTWADYLDRI